MLDSLIRLNSLFVGQRYFINEYECVSPVFITRVPLGQPAVVDGFNPDVARLLWFYFRCEVFDLYLHGGILHHILHDDWF